MVAKDTGRRWDCVVSMTVVLLFPWTSLPYEKTIKGNYWNLSFT